MSVNFKFIFVMFLVSFTELEYISGLNKELGSKLREGYVMLIASEVGHRSCRSKLDKDEGTDLNKFVSTSRLRHSRKTCVYLFNKSTRFSGTLGRIS